MSAFASNPFLFTQVTYDSGALTQLDTVIHGFAEPGDYRGVVLMGDQTSGTFTLQVKESVTALQADIDLAALSGGTFQSGCCGGGAAGPVYAVHPSGYAVFHVSTGAGGYSVTLNKIGQAHDFDSKTLQPGDLFSAVMLRPGTYRARTKEASGHLDIAVSYPAGDRKTAYRPPAAVRVICSGGAFEPANVSLKPAQGIIFEVKQKARIHIELIRADDGAGTGLKKVKRPDQTQSAKRPKTRSKN